MNLVGRIAQAHVPQPLRKILLRKLYADTADALGHPTSPPDTLQAFAKFTAHSAVEDPNSPAVAEHLFAVTYRYGQWLRRVFGLSSTEDAMSAARMVYRAIGIDFQGDSAGDITVRRCYFSHFYTPEACQVMSALDAGLLAGLTGGGRLIFSQRITDGYSCCRAHLNRSEAGE